MHGDSNTWQGMNVTFGKRVEKVDWRRLASVDIDKIKREIDVKTLQDNIMHTTFCNIESELGMYGAPVDPHFVKLFQLSQLIIEYLLHSQEFLTASLEEKSRKADKDQESARENKMLLEKKTEAYHKQKKEVHKLKKWIAEYQLLMRAGASGLHKCPFCGKCFVSQEYLVGHVSRRHQSKQQQQQQNGDVQLSGFHKTATVLEELQSQPTAPTGLEKSVLMDELTRIKERLQVTEQELMNERNARETLILQERDQQSKQDAKVQLMEEKYEKWKKIEEEKHKREMHVLKNSLMQELQAQKDSVTQVLLSELDERTRVRPSMLGSLKDEDEPDFPRGPNKDEIAEMMKEQFDLERNKLMAQNKQELQKELQQLKRKWKAKEENLKEEHEGEMKKLQERLSQYEQAVNSERTQKEVLTKEYDLLRKKVQDHDKALDNQKSMKEKLEQSIQMQQQQLNALSPPTVQRRETTFTVETPLRERAKTPTQAVDTVSLHVSYNESHNQYRLWRESSNTSKEWADLFSFSATSQPSALFTSPVYVYSSGGSPYWRQFISSSPRPPSSEYRMDYMFYASASSGPGMVQLHVLDSGSVPVIKSCVSKSSVLSGWKDKGMFFYVIKSSLASSKTGLRMSASWDSTLESAAVNDNKEEKDFSVSESEADNDEEEMLEESQNMDESTGSATRSLDDSRDMTSGLSSSDWGTTLLEVGEFRPYAKNPYITTRFNHKPPVIQGCRQEIMEVIEAKLEKQGITSGIQQLSSQKMEARMSALNYERQARAKLWLMYGSPKQALEHVMKTVVTLGCLVTQKVKGYADDHQRCVQRVEDIARKTYKPGLVERSSESEAVTRQVDTRSRARPPTLKAAGQVVQLTTALQQPNRNQLRVSQTLSSTGSSVGGNTLSATSVTDGSFSSVTERTLSESEEDEEEEEHPGSQESSWDSASDDEAFREPSAVPKVEVRIPSQNQQGIKTREPRGEKVRELTASLERNLSFGREVKKPAGAVALFDQGPSRQTPPEADDGRLDLADDSDFSLTSLDDSKKPSPQPRSLTSSRVTNTSEPRSLPQPVARPRTLTPNTGTGQRQTSAVTAFTFDDDDFDDDDLDIHHLT